MTRILVTGASGFVGTTLCNNLTEWGHSVRKTVRSSAIGRGPATNEVIIGAIDGTTDWARAVEGVECVYHLAAHAHGATGDADSYRAVNVEGTRRLVEQCLEAGVKRFVFVSSVKAAGEESLGAPLRESDPPAPQDAYGTTKLAAERVLQDLSAGTQLCCTILRPPLVYGPGVKANFRALLDAIWRGIPLPLGAISNRRSFIYVRNLADALRHVLEAGADTRNHVFYVSDGEDLSTPELVRRVAESLGKRPRLVRVPPRALQTAARLLRKEQTLARLAGSLALDISAIRATGWNPPFSVNTGFAATGRWYQEQREKR